MFHWYQIWRRMRELTNKEIEKRAVMEIINFFEPQINAVINQSAIELEKTNKLNEMQGLPKKKRIDHDSIKKAIKTINLNGHMQLPTEGAGDDIEGKGKNNLHMPKVDFSSEDNNYG